ncbi:alkaline phosphatase D family protein [Fulvivirgaceae bacterium BMA12]|uniref:Alkaline phosphatase D family protein n=1 Tax=Agaribacillus aureus TaxID=3051825 RepID=A0ABT8LIT9_9BACT|nr:alkaline phosphatase D family protein [Fulvivirgaceae bacterium BMA12]
MTNNNAKLGILFLLMVLATSGCHQNSKQATYDWKNVGDRTWAGADFWANRLQDWQILDEKLVCRETSEKKPMRTVHLLTHNIEDVREDFRIAVKAGINETTKTNSDAACGLLIGAGEQLDYRAASLIHHSHGRGAGLFLGFTREGQLIITDFSNGEILKQSDKVEKIPGEIRMIVEKQGTADDIKLNLSVLDTEKGNVLLTITLDGLAADQLKGNIALVSHPGKGENGGSFWFSELALDGKAVTHHPQRKLGPIITSQYTIDDQILKITAQLLPIGAGEFQTCYLEIKEGEQWKEVAQASVIVPGFTAPFRVESWADDKDVPYRIKYVASDGASPDYWEGTIKKNPIDKETIVVAGFTGNHNIGNSLDGKRKSPQVSPYPWQELIWFPHLDVVENVKKHNPDVLFFSGDQVYEGGSPTSPDIKNIKLDYLYKWYLWCWAFADLTKDIVTVTIPDDHDVYQGNIWGAGGRPTDKDDKGGYVHPPDFVKMVERTQVSHLPDPYDPTPIEQGIGVYHTDMNFGNISFAILEDRKFKSGPNGLVPPTKSNRADHVIDPDYDPKAVDLPEATLLGERQLGFLNNWADDWRHTDMKVALSQTIFGNLATHHGPNQVRLYMDLDSNGWPQTGRNKALAALRKGFAFMLAGDQHLATIVHHGIDDFDDAGWSFCVPSIANFYPRSWKPDGPGLNQLPGMPDNTGSYLDGFGNHITVYASTNPGKSMGVEPAELHDKMAGYGILKLNKSAQTYTMECWPRFADPENPATGGQYPGWPKTVDMMDNYAKKPVGHLPVLKIDGVDRPVVQVINEATSEVVYTLRIKGNDFQPKVFTTDSYTVIIKDMEGEERKKLTGLQLVEAGKKEELTVSL